MSARSLARRRSVQNQPCGRRRSRPPSVSASTAARAPGPKSGRSVEGQRRLGGGRAQVRAEHVGVVRVEDVGLDGLAEQRLGMVDQVGVQRVVARHHHAECVARAAPGAADLLPQRGPGAGEAGEQHGVEPADVDAELEGVGGGEPEQPPGAQGLLQLAALLGQVAAAVRRHLVDQAGIDLGQQPSGSRGRRSPRPRRDRTKARVRTRSTTRSVSRSATSLAAERRTGAPFSPTPGHERRLPQRQRRAAPRRAVVGDRDDVEAGEPAGRDLRVGHRGRGQHEGRVGAVQRRHPAQPPDDLGDVGAEDPAVVVALVDHDVAQRRRRTATSAHARAAASGAACRGW